MAEASLIAADEPEPVTLLREGGRSPFFLTCDHGGRAIPRRLGRLGLSEAETWRHIAWDIGIAEVGRRLSEALDAALIGQAYSRLVIDCNRDPRVASSIPTVSETTEIPGNRGLGEAERSARRQAVFAPYHAALAAALDRRIAAGRITVLVALHSFTPVFKGAARPWHAGVLYNRDDRLARPLLAVLRREAGLEIGENEPYRVTDETDYTVPVHGERRGLVHVEIELRQDLIGEPAGQAEWAGRLARLLPAAYAGCLAAAAGG
ncbi:MAG TPA: N-formylglutamate amidohydrolase [Stellaceae bacterium]|nr:N-formylglutamate amidohydrolase [Stellaceae bacterium]